MSDRTCKQKLRNYTHFPTIFVHMVFEKSDISASYKYSFVIFADIFLEMCPTDIRKIYSICRKSVSNFTAEVLRS